MNPFDAASPFDARYYAADSEFFERLRPYVAETAQIGYLARVEAAMAETLAEAGVVPGEAAAAIARAAGQVTPEEVYEEERRIEHNIRALVNCLARRVPQSARAYVHLFATSADVMDSARSLCLKELTRDILLADLRDLLRQVIAWARDAAGTPQIGRTHGQHAVPTTWGFALALYVSRLGQRAEAILGAAGRLPGKFSGAVGAYNALWLARTEGGRRGLDPKEIERRFCRRLGLVDAEVSSQIVPPEPYADFAHALTSCWGVMANLADDCRHLMRSEIRELVELSATDAASRRVGSSTMPHKVNPKDFENVKSFWKAYMPRLVTVLLDQVSEHQRDLTNSASMRFLAETAAALAYSIKRLRGALASVSHDAGRMADVLEAGKDPIAAEPLYILLALAGHPEAHEKVRQLARNARVQGKRLGETLAQDPSLAPYLAKVPEEAWAVVRDPVTYLGAAEARTRAVCDAWEARAAGWSVA